MDSERRDRPAHPATADAVGRADPTALRPAAALGAAVLVLATLLACLGGLLALSSLTGGDGETPASPAPVARRGGWSIGDVVPTSFGVVSADHVEKTAGPTAKALSGVTHGISSLVTPDKTQVQVTVTVTNLRRTRTLAYSPLQFRLSSGRARGVRPAGGTIRPGVLQPGASIQGRIAFVVPRDGRQLTLRFRDPSRETPILIDLGRTTRAAPGATAGHYHGGPTP